MSGFVSGSCLGSCLGSCPVRVGSVFGFVSGEVSGFVFGSYSVMSCLICIVYIWVRDWFMFGTSSVSYLDREWFVMIYYR